MTPTRVRLMIATLGLALLAACGGSSSSGAGGPAPSQAGPTSSPSHALPTFVQVKSAIESTGITLCDNSEQGNTHERIFGKSTSGTCNDTAGAGLVYVFTETDPTTFASDQQFAIGHHGSTWTFEPMFIVLDLNPAPGTDQALVSLGFRKING